MRLGKSFSARYQELKTEKARLLRGRRSAKDIKRETTNEVDAVTGEGADVGDRVRERGKTRGGTGAEEGEGPHGIRRA